MSLPVGMPDGIPQPQKPVEPVLPEPLQGKSPAETFALLQNEHLREMEQQKAQHALELEKARLAQAQQQQPKAQTPIAPVETFQPPAQDEQVDIYSDPEKFMQLQMQKRLAPLVDTFTSTQRATNRELFKSKIGEDTWNKYGPEIEQFVDGLAPAVKSSPDAYRVAHQFILGAHNEEIVQEVQQTKAKELAKSMLLEMGLDEEQIAAKFDPQPQQAPQHNSLFQPVTGTAVNSTPPRAHKPVTTPRTKHSDVDKKMMQAFGMTPEEFDEYKKWNT